jgi:hypothetical protein
MEFIGWAGFTLRHMRLIDFMTIYICFKDGIFLIYDYQVLELRTGQVTLLYTCRIHL